MEKIILGNPRSEKALLKMKEQLNTIAPEMVAEAHALWTNWDVYGRNTVIIINEAGYLLYTNLEDEPTAERFTVSDSLDLEAIETALKAISDNVENFINESHEQLEKGRDERQNKVIYKTVKNQMGLDLAIKEAEEQGYRDAQPKTPKNDLYRRFRDKEPYGVVLLVKRYHGQELGYLWQLSTDRIERDNKSVKRLKGAL